jgi:hypothetical protein
MATPSAPQSLAAALNFNTDDLSANRGGNLSQAQAERLQRLRFRSTLITVLIVVINGVAASAFLFIGQREESFLLILVGIGVTIINAILVARAIQNWLRVQSDLQKDAVANVSGEVTRTARVFGRRVFFVLAIGRQEFVVNKPVFNAVAEQKRYRLYYSPRSRTLLSAEAI